MLRESLRDRHCAPVELGHWLITKRGPEVVRSWSLAVGKLAFRVENEIGASGKRPTVLEGNGAVAKALVGGLRSQRQRVSANERAM
jgi:hypothetical protein